MSILGIDNYKTSDLTGSVLILYDAKQLNKAKLVEILDSAIAQAEVSEAKDKADLHLPLCTASLPLAAAAQFRAHRCSRSPPFSSPTPRSRPSATPARSCSSSDGWAWTSSTPSSSSAAWER